MAAILSRPQCVNKRNCRPTMPVTRGRSTRDAQTHTLIIGVFKCIQNNSTMIKHIYHEIANLIDVAFDTSDRWNPP